jgi:hypothetical protein
VFLPGGSITATMQHTNTQGTKAIHIKQTKQRKIISQSYTNSEGHFTDDEYSVEEGKELLYIKYAIELRRKPEKFVFPRIFEFHEILLAS